MVDIMFYSRVTLTPLALNEHPSENKTLAFMFIITCQCISYQPKVQQSNNAA